MYRPVQLRVLRLNKPQLASIDGLGKDIYVDGLLSQGGGIDPLLGATTRLFDRDATCKENEPDLGLVLPKGFGKVLAGELFACLLVVQADKEEEEEEAFKVSVSIQLPKGDDVEILKPTQVKFEKQKQQDYYKCFVLKYSLKEAGPYALAVNIVQVNSQKSFRELYRFIAQQCLALRTKLSQYNNNNMIIIQAQIENISDSTVMLESADYLPISSKSGGVGDINKVYKRLPNQSTMQQQQKQPILRPKDVYQYGYVISHEDNTTTTIGRVSLAWRREPFGERGYLATSPLRLN